MYIISILCSNIVVLVFLLTFLFYSLRKIVSPKKGDSESNNVEVQMELDEEMENDICKVWDMSMDKVMAILLSFMTTKIIQKAEKGFSSVF